LRAISEASVSPCEHGRWDPHQAEDLTLKLGQFWGDDANRGAVDIEDDTDGEGEQAKDLFGGGSAAVPTLRIEG
jgi:hypothetical protein